LCINHRSRFAHDANAGDYSTRGVGLSVMMPVLRRGGILSRQQQLRLTCQAISIPTGGSLRRNIDLDALTVTTFIYTVLRILY